jgi:hypothetical protein
MLVDDMTEQHAKNALKMVIRKLMAFQEELNKKSRPKFEIKGDIAQDHIDQMMLAEYQEDQDYEEI